MWSPVEKCWVPCCANSRDQGYQKNFFPLPSVLKFKEIWLALAAKKSAGSRDEIYFCQDHFEAAAIETYMEKFVCLKATAVPYFNMPERICRTCMSIIVEREVFCVLSANIPSAIPADIKSDLLTFRPEPLLQLLTFCIPEVNLYPDPPPLVCYKCFHTIWLFYVFKLTCNAVEKTLRGTLSIVEYGKMVICRSCPTNSGTSFFNLREDSPMGGLLKKMFLNNYSVDVVPLKVCLKCWNILYKLERFYAQCLAVEQKIQRHITLTQMSQKITVQPPTKTPDSELCKTVTNPLREYRKTVHPYQRTAENNSSRLEDVRKLMPGNNVGTNSSGTTKEEMVDCTVDEATVRYVPDRPSTSQGPSGLKVLHTVQQSGTQETLKDKSEATDNFVENANDREWTKNRLLSPVEKVILAELMLKHGKSLKRDVSSKIHFEAWVLIVREFHRLGSDRSLETIQNVWNYMKKSAKVAFETIGPATYANQLVIDYLYDFQDNKQPSVGTVSNTAKAPQDCDIICIDGDDDEIDRNVGVEVETPASGEPSKVVKTARPRDEEKVKKKAGRAKKTKRKKGSPIKDCWDKEENLKLVRSMRKEYDRCLKSNQLFSGKSPWKRIVERLIKTEYANYDFKKLYAVWSKLKVSAKVHEKNGLDVVDKEVWNLLQMRNPVDRNVTDKGESSNDSVDRVPAIVVAKNGDQSTSRQENKGNKRNLRPQRASCFFLHDDFSSDSDTGPKLPKRKPGRPPKDKKNASQDPEANKGLSLTEEEKMKFFKLIKKEFHLLLKNGESVSTPWAKLVDRVYNNGYKVGPVNALTVMWYKMRHKATLHENSGKRSILDDKILRLLKLHDKVKNTRGVLRTKDKSDDKAIPEVAKNTRTRQAAQTTKATKKTIESAASRSEAEAESDTQERFYADRHQRRMDLISVLKAYGDEVFKKTNKSARRAFWLKVEADLNAKGYTIGIKKFRVDWYNILASAKHAWADQKQKPTCYDKAIIDFMTDVIKKKEDGECSKGNDEKDEDQQDEDDRFDEISERMSNASNNSPANPTSEEEKAELEYDYVSLADIENDYGVDVEGGENSGTCAIKSEPVEDDAGDENQKSDIVKTEPLPFKIESYTSEEIIEIPDSDED